MANESRCNELSTKFLQMGEALIEEGSKESDYQIAQSGTIMVLLSSLITSEQDMFIFSELSSMFVSKKILDEKEKVNPIEAEIFAKILAETKAKRENKVVPKKRRGRKPGTDKPDAQQ